MSTLNPFELLVDDDAEDPALLLAALQKAAAPAKASAQSQPAAKPSAKLPAKPLPPAQAVRESRNEGQRGGRGGARGRGGRGFGRDSVENVNKFENGNGYSGGYNRRTEDGDAGKAPSERRQYGGPRGGGGGGAAFRGGDRNGESEEGDRPRRTFERRSGTGRGNEIKREGGGRGNWGTPNEEIAPETEEPTTEVKKVVDSEKKSGDDETDDANKDSSAKEREEKEAEEEKEMTLEEYEKVLEEKRKTLLSMKSEARKVNVDKELESMQLLSSKKTDHDDVFIKLGSDKDKRKEAAEKAKKSVSINEFLKPVEGEKYNRGGGRGRGRGRGREGGVGGGFGRSERAPAIEDVDQFPSLGGKSN
ncbi:hypothetical protein ABFX02_01G104900 [Erythranthe guttata]